MRSRLLYLFVVHVLISVGSITGDLIFDSFCLYTSDITLVIDLYHKSYIEKLLPFILSLYKHFETDKCYQFGMYDRLRQSIMKVTDESHLESKINQLNFNGNLYPINRVPLNSISKDEISNRLEKSQPLKSRIKNVGL